MPLNTCNTSYKTNAPSCMASYKIGGLLPSVMYYVIMTDKFGNKYEINSPETPASASGDVTVNFPDDIAEVGEYVNIQIFSHEELIRRGAICDPITFSVCGITYTSIEVKFIEFTGTHLPNQWNLICPCTPSGCAPLCGQDVEILSISEVKPTSGIEGWYLADYGPYIHHNNEDGILDILYECTGAAHLYFEGKGPHVWDADDSQWEPALEFYNTDYVPGTATISIVGNEVFFGQNAKYIPQISEDGGLTWTDLEENYRTFAQIEIPFTVTVDATSFRLRCKVVTDAGCEFYSFETTQTE
jgi:hypothetical protein